MIMMVVIIDRDWPYKALARSAWFSKRKFGALNNCSCRVKDGQEQVKGAILMGGRLGLCGFFCLLFLCFFIVLTPTAGFMDSVISWEAH